MSVGSRFTTQVEDSIPIHPAIVAIYIFPVHLPKTDECGLFLQGHRFIAAGLSNFTGSRHARHFVIGGLRYRGVRQWQCRPQLRQTLAHMSS
jgi:hypothetical protein